MSVDAATTKTVFDAIAPYLFGGLAGMGATMIVQPIDLLKTRMQISGEMGAGGKAKSSLHLAKDVIKAEGLRGMYRGLSAGLMRQATYTTTRLGFFNYMKSVLSPNSNDPLPFWKKAIAGITAGGVGAIVGTPAEVGMIRMMSDGRLPVEQRRGYKHIFDALFRIVKEEGVLALWRGCVPTVSRAMILNCAQLATYDQAKQMLLGLTPLNDNIYTHFAASLVSGFISTVVSMPADIAKTRIQNMRYVDGKPQYKGTFDVLIRTAKTEGLFSLWKGFTPYFLRLGPHTIFTFIFLEQLHKLYRHLKN